MPEPSAVQQQQDQAASDQRARLARNTAAGIGAGAAVGGPVGGAIGGGLAFVGTGINEAAQNDFAATGEGSKHPGRSFTEFGWVTPEEYAAKKGTGGQAAVAPPPPTMIQAPRFGGWSNLGTAQGEARRQTGFAQVQAPKATPANPGASPNGANSAQPGLQLGIAPPNFGPAAAPASSPAAPKAQQSDFNPSSLAAPKMQPWTPVVSSAQTAPSPAPGLSPGQQQQQQNPYRFGAP